MAMTDFRIIFTETDISLPDGANCGVQGEHNAVQLVITLPQSMIEDITYHTVTIGGVESALIVDTHESADGAYRVGNVLYFPLTAAWTQQTIVDLYVTAYRQVGSAVQLVDKTPTVYGLRFSPSGTPDEVQPGGLVGQIYDLNQKVDDTVDWVKNYMTPFWIDDNGNVHVNLDNDAVSVDEDGNVIIKAVQEVQA